MGFWQRRIDKRQHEDKMVGQLIEKLSEKTDWVYNNEYSYKHRHSELVVMWGEYYEYDYSVTYRCISEPEYFSIPTRFRKQISSLLKSIRNARNLDNEETPTSFLSNYMASEYCNEAQPYNKRMLAYNVNKGLSDEVNTWLSEEINGGFYISSGGIYFREEEEAVLYKLRWGGKMEEQDE